jgi:hypothetical protein
MRSPTSLALRRTALVRLATIAALVLAACQQGERGGAPRVAATDTPAAVALPVDSYLPPEEALRRFREGVPQVTRLSGGAPTRDSLVALFEAAVRDRDTALVNRLIVSRAEFAWLVYPSSPLREPPYELDPQMAWYQLRMQSEKGISRVLDRMGGPAFDLLGHRCPKAAAREGENEVWQECVVRLREPGGGEDEARLFGSIVRRGEQFKFAGYGNDL